MYLQYIVCKIWVLLNFLKFNIARQNLPNYSDFDVFTFYAYQYEMLANMKNKISRLFVFILKESYYELTICINV